MDKSDSSRFVTTWIYVFWWWCKGWEEKIILVSQIRRGTVGEIVELKVDFNVAGEY